MKKEKQTPVKAIKKQSRAYRTSSSSKESINLVEDNVVFYQSMYTDTMDILVNSRTGLQPKAAFDFISVSGFTANEFQQTFKTTVKTIQNYSLKNTRLDAAISEKLLKSFALFKLGIDVFGSAKDFVSWLHVPAYGLGNQVPFDLMDTITGLSFIEEELSRIAYGDLA